jgi:hypothetical protein
MDYRTERELADIVICSGYNTRRAVAVRYRLEAYATLLSGVSRGASKDSWWRLHKPRRDEQWRNVA